MSTGAVHEGAACVEMSHEDTHDPSRPAKDAGRACVRPVDIPLIIADPFRLRPPPLLTGGAFRGPSAYGQVRVLTRPSINIQHVLQSCGAENRQLSAKELVLLHLLPNFPNFSVQLFDILGGNLGE